MARFTELLQDRGNGREPGVPWFVHDKIRCAEFMDILRIPTVEVLRRFETPEAIDLVGLPTEFVLKPTYESSSRGVMVLERLDDGYYESMRDKKISLDEIVEKQQELFDGSKSKNRMTIVEKKIVDSSGLRIPMDYKAYTFQGEIAFVVGFDRNNAKTRISWFDSNFDPMDLSRVSTNEKYLDLERDPVRPTNWRELLNLATRASIATPAPFVSVDMYDHIEGPLLGELTLVPGAFYFGKYFVASDEEDYVLGRMWERARDRLIRA
ncbi:ATP-grasp fold amidoligase family protein [Isoptericola sp. 178]|uniref:ATP-grasp fold amidoligase family protein n=1 Tax=Isoptericola sp. 178 TaxID=3064651 RepID=UPI002713E69A|nr:ATP-grasp fold amidoligase family protein [Isoptericola sp. 178]MDO8143936.1 ATP-grasp fold amidoligase family protein [Isoptericola sp. 178]